jgi:hypothetical protein
MRAPATDELRRLLDAVGHPETALIDGKLPAMAGSDDPPQNPVANPLGGADVDGTLVTVDVLVNPPTRIPAIIRNLVANNQGYFAEEIFATPGMTVEGGAILYEETFPEDYFLPEDKSIAPRAPGAPAPRLGSTRRPVKVARPESWSGSIEVHDEARRRNQVWAIQRQFTQMANTFADRIQSRALETLDDFITATGRTQKGLPWRVPLATGAVNADPADLPQHDFAAVTASFIADKAGNLPSLVILHQNDWLVLATIYDGVLRPSISALLQTFNLVAKISPHATEGKPIFVKGGGIGVMAFETPLRQEYTREGTKFTDVFTVEATPVFVALDAASILQLTGVEKDK